MKRAAMVCLAALLLLCSAGAVSAAWDGTAIIPFTAGDGTAANPFVIDSEGKLAYFAQQVNLNNATVVSGNISVTQALDLGNHPWEPIGNTTTDSPSTKIFKGTFNGSNYTITNMNVTATASSSKLYAGLFGYVDGAVIRNVGVVDANVTAALTITSYVNGGVSAYAGGLAGYVKGGSIQNCYATGKVNATGNRTRDYPIYAYAGGLTGYATGSSIQYCYGAGEVTATATSSASYGGFAYAGGLTGYAMDGSIQYCYATGKVTATATATSSSANGSAWAGGLAGYATGGSIQNCYGAAEVTATSAKGSAYAGGLAGYAKNDSIQNCYGAAEVTATVTTTSYSSSAYGGGLAGRVEDSSIQYCYATGEVTATDTNPVHVGGLAGYAKNDSITNSTGLNPWVNATGRTLNIGRFVGTFESATLTDHFAWRHMVLNSSSRVTKSVTDPSGKNATNASTLMIWNNKTFFQTLFGASNYNANWTMGTNTYKLPILKWQSAAPAVDASHLNITHEVNATVTGTGGTISPPGKQNHQDGVSVAFTLTADPGCTLTLTDNGVTKTGISTSYALSDVDQPHEIVAVFTGSPGPTTHTITATAGQNGAITPSGSVTVPHGGSQTFHITPDPGYAIADLLIDGRSWSPVPDTFEFQNVDRDRTIHAVFTGSSPAGDSSGDGNMDTAYRTLFETSGGSFISPATGLSAGDIITAPPAPVKDGYTFGGWYTNEDCTKEWNFADGITGDMTLYAKWTAAGGSPAATATAKATEKTATEPQQTQTTADAATQTMTTAAAGTTPAGAAPTLEQMPAPVFGMLAGLLAAGVLRRRK